MPTPFPETEKSPPRETAIKIMDAAEQLFAAHGYEGTSIRQITDLAGVRLALAHYHFDSKEHMFCEVLTRRASVVNESRYQLLAHYRLARGSAALTVEEIARCYISPYLYWSMHGGGGWQNYAKLAARIISTERWMELLSALFNPLAHAFLQELRRTFPGREEHRIQWAFDFMVGAMSNTFSENNRIVALSNGLCSSANHEDACSHLLPFVVAGVTTTVDAAPASFVQDFAAIQHASPRNN